jgi:hypothetical protein
MENGYDLFLWIGRTVSPAIINTLFGVSTLEGADISTLAIQSDNRYDMCVVCVCVCLRVYVYTDIYMYMHCDPLP